MLGLHPTLLGVLYSSILHQLRRLHLRVHLYLQEEAAGKRSLGEENELQKSIMGGNLNVIIDGELHNLANLIDVFLLKQIGKILNTLNSIPIGNILKKDGTTLVKDQEENIVLLDQRLEDGDIHRPYLGRLCTL
ncbi:MAG: hypothetical protein EOM68_23560 [Spirochaetia bacterium]|nr:hypothetical protein [Spirochaetia bacterium]